MNGRRLIVWVSVVSLLSGCALQEVRSKSKVGPEFRHSGSSGTDSERWTVQQGVEFKWDGGINTGVTYRRRDVNDGNGDDDNGVWFEFSFPLWKAPKEPDALAQRMETLEQRLAELEKQLPAGLAPARAEPEPQTGDN